MTTISDITSNILSDYYSAAGNASKTGAVGTTSSTDTTSTTTTTTTANTSYTNKTALGRYINSAENPDAKTMFEKLSLDLGGDGKSITKGQLDSYISSAKSGKIEVPKEQLDAMKELQSNWEDISTGGDSITYYDVSAAGHKDTILSMLPETQDKPDYQKIADDATAKAYSQIVNAALNGLNNDKPDSSPLNSLLNSLLSGTTDKNDDANAELIAQLTNILAENNATSTVDLLV